jgi:hypothetical protein
MGRKIELQKSNTVRAISLSKQHYNMLEYKIYSVDKKIDNNINFSKKIRELMRAFIEKVENEGAYIVAFKLMGYSPVPNDAISKNFRCSNKLYGKYVKFAKSIGVEPTELLRRLVAIEIGEFDNTFTPHKLSEELNAIKN